MLANTELAHGAELPALASRLAFPLGVAAATRRAGRLDAAVSLFCFAGISVPAFWLALLLILASSRSSSAGCRPSGIANIGDGALVDRARHLVLPVLTLTLLPTGALHPLHARRA